MYDLHTHTVFSDGTTTPERNVALAAAAGLAGIGVTDHDTTAGWDRAVAAAGSAGIEVVPGAELSAELDGLSVHILGYWFDPHDPALAAEMERVRTERTRRAEEICRRFADLGVDIRMERVVEIAGGAPIGRPHLAAAVVEAGAAADVGDAFDRWLRDGAPAYIPKDAVSPEHCVRLVVDAGGVAVLAHPGVYGRDREGLSAEVVESLAAAGLAGIEADHPDHDDDERALYRDLADGLGLVVVAGSDFHGERKELRLGQAATPRAALEDLAARCAHGTSSRNPWRRG